jgi:hypothetical protein
MFSFSSSVFAVMLVWSGLVCSHSTVSSEIMTVLRTLTGRGAGSSHHLYPQRTTYRIRRRSTSMWQMGFEPKIPTFGRPKTAPRALACRATVIGKLYHFIDLSNPFTVATCKEFLLVQTRQHSNQQPSATGVKEASISKAPMVFFFYFKTLFSCIFSGHLRTL